MNPEYDYPNAKLVFESVMKWHLNAFISGKGMDIAGQNEATIQLYLQEGSAIHEYDMFTSCHGYRGLMKTGGYLRLSDLDNEALNSDIVIDTHQIYKMILFRGIIHLHVNQEAFDKLFGNSIPIKGIIFLEIKNKKSAKQLVQQCNSVLPDKKDNETSRCSFCDAVKERYLDENNYECPICLQRWGEGVEIIRGFHKVKPLMGQTIRNWAVILEILGVIIDKGGIQAKEIVNEFYYMGAHLNHTMGATFSRNIYELNLTIPQVEKGISMSFPEISKAYSYAKSMNHEDRISVYGFMKAKYCIATKHYTEAIPLLQEGFEIDRKNGDWEGTFKAMRNIIYSKSKLGNWESIKDDISNISQILQSEKKENIQEKVNDFNTFIKDLFLKNNRDDLSPIII